MRDRALVGRFFLRALGIDVNPLAVFGSFGELHDSLLRNEEPIADANFLSYEFLQRTGSIDNGWRHESLQ